MDFLVTGIGFFAGIASGLFGLGGGTILVPSMLSLGMSMQHAIGISVMQMMFSSTFGSFLNYRKKIFSFKEGVVLGLGGLVGASFSGLVLKSFSEVILGSIFLLLTLYSFVKFLNQGRGRKQVSKVVQKAWQAQGILFATGVVTGVFAISLGIGGGMLIVPVLSYYLGYDVKKCVALSLFFIIFASISGSLSFFRQEVLDMAEIYSGLSVGLASMVGVSVGIYGITKIPARAHKVMLACIYIVSMSVMVFHLIEKL